MKTLKYIVEIYINILKRCVKNCSETFIVKRYIIKQITEFCLEYLIKINSIRILAKYVDTYNDP